MVNKLLEAAKINIDLLALKIECLQGEEKDEALRDLEELCIQAPNTSSNNVKKENSKNFCSICSKSYTEINTHMNIHKEKFKCEKCGKCFVGKFKLEKHRKSNLSCNIFLRKLSAIQNINCSLCDFKTNSIGNLTKHLSTHSANNECNTCKKRFRQTNDLQRHQKKKNNCLKYLPWKHLFVRVRS